MNKCYVFIAFGVILLACEKNILEKEPESLSEIIHGKWEWRESINDLIYNDLEYHKHPPNYYPTMVFNEDGSFVSVEETDTVERGTFTLVREDSILAYNNHFKIFGFSADTLDLRYSGRHGPLGRKLFKLH